jgi:hypothetical protein
MDVCVMIGDSFPMPRLPGQDDQLALPRVGTSFGPPDYHRIFWIAVSSRRPE